MLIAKVITDRMVMMRFAVLVFMSRMPVGDTGAALRLRWRTDCLRGAVAAFDRRTFSRHIPSTESALPWLPLCEVERISDARIARHGRELRIYSDT